MLFHAALLGALAALAAASPIEQRAINPTVTIASGVIVGTASSVSNQATVTGLASAFLAIPFAASPTRFAPPSAPTNWATKTVTAVGSACPQPVPFGTAGAKVVKYFENPFGPTPLPESEDCLHVNVFVPPNTSKTSGKTVMVWIYGGDLTGGANAPKYYNGSSLAVNYDVIVVVPNYRVGFLGFSSSPDIPFGQQNSGFLDQRFALQWVQTNIAAFGGDPNKVTIFGESAGGYSVKQLLAQPPSSPPPFRAAIMESSGYTIGGNGPAAWNKVVANFCSNKPNGQTNLQCLRAQKVSDIQFFVSNPANNITFAPVLDQTYVASSTLDELRSGKFADVPLLIGHNNNEATIFADIAGYSDSSDIVSSVAQLTGLNLGTAAANTSSLYPGLSGFQLLSRVATDLAFTCTESLFATAVALNNSSPVWRYRFDPDFPNIRYFNGAGAYHSAEVPEVFGTYPLNTQYGTVTTDQIALSSYMQNAWTTFAKNPSTGPAPGSWDAYIKPFSLKKIGVLGGKNSTAGLNLQDALFTDYSCPVYNPILLAANYAF